MSTTRKIVPMVVIAVAVVFLAASLCPSPAAAGCKPGVEKRLHDAYKKWCDKSGTRSCTKKIRKGDCDEYKRRAEINKICYEGRKEMTDTCYDGNFDAGHKKAYDDAVRAYNTCISLIRKYNCQ